MTDQNQNRYLAIPPSGKGPGVLALHAWWGLNDFFRSFCDRLAREGFVVLAPDLFHGKIARTIEEAEHLRDEVEGGWEQSAAEAKAALNDLRKRPEVTGSGLGVVGFSMGAFYALLLSNACPEDIRAVVVFYGTGADDFSQSQAAYQGHFAADDPFEPAEGIEETLKLLKAAGRPVDFYTYPDSGHWFFENDRPDAYNAEAAQQAWERMVTFFHQQLGG